MITDERFQEPRHPIGVAAERTGLSTDLVRAWERRYGAVEPVRDGTGQRLYSDADVERLRLLRRATEGGRSISQVAGLDRGALMELVQGDESARAARRSARGGDPAGGEDAGVAELVERALALDVGGLESALGSQLLDRGMVDFAESVARPLLQRLGDGWHAGEVSVAQEHAASAAVRRVLESTRVSMSPSGSAPVLVGTLEGERHEAGALSVASAVALAGRRVVYLGPDLPVSELAEAARSAEAGVVCVSATFSASEELAGALRALRTELPAEVVLYAGGPAVAPVKEELEGYGVRCPEDLRALRRALEAA